MAGVNHRGLIPTYVAVAFLCCGHYSEKRPPDPNEIDRLIDDLGSNSHKIWGRSFDRLKDAGDMVVPHLIDALDSAPSQRKARIVCLLGYIGDEQAETVMLEMLGTGDSPEVERAVMQALSKKCSDIAPASFYIRLRLEADDPDTRATAAEALGLLGDTGSVEALLKRLDDSDNDVRLFAVQSLGKIGDASVVPTLAARPKDPTPEVRAATAWTLGRLRSPSGVEWLVDGLNDPDARVRERSAEALGSIGEARAESALFDLIDDSARTNERITAAASSALRAIAIRNAGENTLDQAHAQVETAWQISKVSTSPRAVSDFWYGIRDIEKHIPERHKFKTLKKLLVRYAENPPPPTGKIDHELGRCYDYWGLRDYDKAIEHYSRCLAESPGSQLAKDAEKAISRIREKRHTSSYATGILKLDILSNKETYTEGEPIWVRAKLTNISDTTVVIQMLESGKAGVHGAGITAAFHVEDLKGNEIWPLVELFIERTKHSVSEQMLLLGTSAVSRRLAIPSTLIRRATDGTGLTIVCQYRSYGGTSDCWEGTLYAELRLPVWEAKEFDQGYFVGIQESYASQGERKPLQETILAVAHDYWDAGAYEEAVRILRIAIETFPDWETPREQLEDLHKRSLIGSPYLLCIRAGVRPGNTEVLYFVGNCYFELGEYEKAMESYRAYAESGEDKRRIDMSLFMIGRSLFELGKYQDATEYFEKTLSTNSESRSYFDRCLEKAERE